MVGVSGGCLFPPETRVQSLQVTGRTKYLDGSSVARRVASGGVVAFAIYCGSAIGLLEIVRLFYFGSSRFLPVLIAGLGLYVSWKMVVWRSSFRRSMFPP
jgi:hypothetical protein